MGKSQFKVALLGYGLAGRAFHAPLIAVTPALELSIIVTSNEERSAQAARDFPDARILGSSEQVWGSGVDLVVVATPNRSHAPLAHAAMESGMAVVVDKPFTRTAEEGRQLVDAAKRRGTLLTVYQNRRWDGDFLTIQKLMKEDAFGGVCRFESNLERWRPALKGGWRELSDPAEAGGLLYDLGSHLIDQALVLFGPVSDVYAEVDRCRQGAAIDDDTFLALKHANGVRSHLYASVIVAQPGPRLRVLGSKAAYMKFQPDPQEALLRSGVRPGPGWGEEPPEHWGLFGVGDEVRRIPTIPGAYQDFYAGVVRAMRGEAPPPVDPADAIAGLEVIEKARGYAQ